MAFTSRLISQQLKPVAFAVSLQKITIAENFVHKPKPYHTVNSRALVHNSKYAERDRYTGAAVVSNVGRRICQVVAKPVLITTISQTVRPFCWQQNNCKESEIGSRVRREYRQFSSEIKSAKRKMVNLLVLILFDRKYGGLPSNHSSHLIIDFCSFCCVASRFSYWCCCFFFRFFRNRFKFISSFQRLLLCDKNNRLF